jgi:hypothetical protein
MLAAVAEKLPHPEVAEVTTVPFVPCRPGILNVMVDELWAAKLELLKVNDTAVAELVSELLRVRLVVLFWNFVISGDEGIAVFVTLRQFRAIPTLSIAMSDFLLLPVSA